MKEYSSFQLDKNVIYADLCIYRYVGAGELTIYGAENVIWAYSFSHLEEIHRGVNRDALHGMKKLKAREIFEVIDTSSLEWRLTGEYRIRDYIDPFDRFLDYEEAVSNTSSVAMDGVLLFLNRLFDADNQQVLEQAISNMPEHIQNMLEDHPTESKRVLADRSKEVSSELLAIAKEQLSELPTISERRKELGIPVNISQLANGHDDPIALIWEKIRSIYRGVNRDTFFGYSHAHLEEQSIHAFSQASHFQGPHFVLSLLGFHPDKGMKDRQKILNALSDAQHVGVASYCQGLLSSDRRFIEKANAVYQHKKLNCRVILCPHSAYNWTLTIANAPQCREQ